MTEREQFYAELNTIMNVELRDFVEKAMTKVPENFWEIAASSTGKHHPEQSNGTGGLVRHILAGLYFVRELCISYTASEEEKDYCIAAMLLHDVGKAIAEPHDIVWTTALRYLDKEGKFNALIAGVRWHMGKWSLNSTDCIKEEQGAKKFPEDFSRIEQIVHLADYVASRKRVVLTKLGSI
jgi:butyrate kinase